MLFRRSQQNRTLTGLLGAIAAATGCDYTWLRFAFVLLVLITGGWAIVAYGAAALVSGIAGWLPKGEKVEIDFYEPLFWEPRDLDQLRPN